MVSKAGKINPGQIFVSPAVVFFAVLIMFPAFYVLYLSLSGAGAGGGTGMVLPGLRNYLQLFADRKFTSSVGHTVVFAGLSTVLHVGLGMVIASFLNTRLNPKVVSACRALIFIPWAISPVAVAVAGRLLCHPQLSPIALLLKRMNWQMEWAPLASPKTALMTLVAINTWHYTPFYTLMILSGLQGIPEEIYEASSIDGATGFQQFWYITIPQVRTLLYTLALFDLVTTAIYFDLVWVTTQGGPVWSTELLVTYVYRTAFHQYNFGLASAAGVVLLIITLLLSMATLRVMERR